MIGDTVLMARLPLWVILAGAFVLTSGARAGWEPIGPYAGGVSPAAIVGEDLYAIGAAGIWRSPDRGVTWTCSPVRWPPLEILPFASRLYAASGASGILVSTDRGSTWNSLVENVSGEDSMALHTAYSLFAFGRYLFAGTAYGIYRSGDSGDTWNRVDGVQIPADGSFNVDNFEQLESRIYAGTELGIYVSAVSGSAGSWTRMANPHASWTGGISTLGRFLYLWGDEEILRSADQGATWDTLLRQEGGIRLWSSDPILYLYHERDSTLSRSLDSGRTWIPLQKVEEFNEIHRQGDTVWVHSWTRGLMKSVDGGFHFQDVPVRAGSFHVLGTSGRRVLLPGYGISRDQGSTWERDGQLPQLGFANQLSVAGDLAVASEYNSGKGRLHLSRDGGLSWTGLPHGFPLESVMQWGVQTVAIHGGRLFVARRDGVYRSADSGSTWHNVRPYSNRAVPMTAYRQDALQSAGPDLFLADSGRIYKSADGGDNWVPATQGIQGWIRLLAGNSEAVYAAGYSGLFRSIDRGASWSKVDGERTGLTNLLALGKASLATWDSNGVELSLDGGVTWKRSNEGLSISTWASGMAIDSQYAYISIYGGSLWRRSLGELFPLTPSQRLTQEPGAGEGFRLYRGASGTSVEFTLTHRGQVSLEAFNPQGCRTSVLAKGPMRPGRHVVPFNAWKSPSGVHILRLRADGAIRYLKVPPGI